MSIHVDGDAAWSEFHWEFRATMRKDKLAVKMRRKPWSSAKKLGAGVWFMSITLKIARPSPKRLSVLSHVADEKPTF